MVSLIFSFKFSTTPSSHDTWNQCYKFPRHIILPFF